MPIPLIIAAPLAASALGIGAGFALSDELGKTLRFVALVGATIVVVRYREQIFSGGSG